MGRTSYNSSEELINSLSKILKGTAGLYELPFYENDNITDKFYELIAELHRKTGEKVVVLIDEYDKPIIDNLPEPALAGDDTSAHSLYPKRDYRHHHRARHYDGTAFCRQGDSM